jgi:hypothetical protein
MSQLVKTKRQPNFKDFKRPVEQKKNVFNSLVCKLVFFGTRGPLNWPTYAKKSPIYTRTR